MVSEYSFETSARPTLEKPWQHPKQDKNNAAKNTQVQFRFYLSISIIIIIIIIIVIYSCYPFRGHRASTKHSHLVLFPAILITSLYLFPFSNSSFWTVLPYVCLCLPLLIFSCGFHSKASLSMASWPFLSVRPIQFHFLLLICVDISISSALLHSSSFEITFGQWMFRILRKGEGKSVPLQGWRGPEGSRKLRFPDLMTTAQGGGKVVSITHRPHLPPENSPGTHFY